MKKIWRLGPKHWQWEVQEKGRNHRGWEWAAAVVRKNQKQVRLWKPRKKWLKKKKWGSNIMTNSAKDHQGMLKEWGEQESRMEIHRLSINYKGENVPLEWSDLVVTTLPKNPNLASPRVRKSDNMGLWCDAMGSAHYLHAILAKKFNQNLLLRKKTNLESETFFKTTELHCPKCQCHGGKKNQEGMC